MHRDRGLLKTAYGVHRIPNPTFVTIAKRPSYPGGAGEPVAVEPERRDGLSPGISTVAGAFLIGAQVC
jgi:hypothetical protein